jgi:hypothetical protein
MASDEFIRLIIEGNDCDVTGVKKNISVLVGLLYDSEMGTLALTAWLSRGDVL